MGYRSDVAVAIGFTSREALVAFLATYRLASDPSTMDQLMEDFRITELGKTLVLHCNYNEIKWYDGYDDVKRVHKLLSEANEAGYSTAFIRIGEEDNDTESEFNENDEHTQLWEFFGVKRELICLDYDCAVNITDYINTQE
jgi:hypothetical protein